MRKPNGQPVRAEGVIERLEIVGLYYARAREELEKAAAAVVAGKHSDAAWAQIRGARTNLRHSLEGVREAKRTLKRDTVPIEEASE